MSGAISSSGGAYPPTFLSAQHRHAPITCLEGKNQHPSLSGLVDPYSLYTLSINPTSTSTPQVCGDTIML